MSELAAKQDEHVLAALGAMEIPQTQHKTWTMLCVVLVSCLLITVDCFWLLGFCIELLLFVVVPSTHFFFWNPRNREVNRKNDWWLFWLVGKQQKMASKRPIVGIVLEAGS